MYLAPALVDETGSLDGEEPCFQLPIFAGLPFRRFGVLGWGLRPIHWYNESSWNEVEAELVSRGTRIPALTSRRPICLPMYLHKELEK